MNPTTSKNRWWLVAATGVAVFMAQLDGTVVNVALPTIEHDMGVGTSVAEWVVLGYVLPLIALTLPSGRWLDRVGQRPALIFAVAGFALAGAAVGLAPGIEWLIGARVVQGAFGAVLFALVPVLTTTAVRPEVRGRAMGIVMTLGPLGGISGPVLGGLLIETLGWPWIFYLNVPVALVVVAIGFAQLPGGGGLRVPGRSWLAETALLSAAAVALMLALSLSAGHGLGWLALAPAAVPFVLAWRKLPASRPVRELMRAPGITGPHLALLAEMAAIMTVQFLVPFHLQRVAGASPAEIGLTMLAFPLAVMVFGLLGGFLADRWPASRVALTGVVIVTVALVLIAPLSASWGPADLAWRLALGGIGAGLFAGPNQTMTMARTPAHLLGTTGASTSLARQLGIALGPALATTTWAVSGGLAAAVWPAVGLAALSVLALAVRPRTTSMTAPSEKTLAGAAK